ncbi:hypothetical protein A3C37_00085 [Candidatus Peribacteria bacterium RIFCSPHIGHO2_02_FULL_53_20]|nr:MAG: hypothetical protein A3C37_00085 [Candidatus Peribacteria bacterium RIFCSPHIGHO2_02_FULL_53_20]OGJ68177.1 MAG: hypothetical protein A3B61_05205 [Candidatus Peribacteria bacterium RIFCSPLOWO2_01_FULL_53_10]OGJ73653.1 MAG: hypothetical protein A3G69_05565 [Candidatus Peribacteria bacterium RIFCSPLOWO2_12_FULL_53_10]
MFVATDKHGTFVASGTVHGDALRPLANRMLVLASEERITFVLPFSGSRYARLTLANRMLRRSTMTA